MSNGSRLLGKEALFNQTVNLSKNTKPRIAPTTPVNFLDKNKKQIET